MVTAFITYGYSLHHLRLQPQSHTVTASMTYGYSLHYLRLQPSSPTVIASITYGYSFHHLRLQPPLHTVTASITYGYSLNHLRLQAQCLCTLDGGTLRVFALVDETENDALTAVKRLEQEMSRAMADLSVEIEHCNRRLARQACN